MYRLAITLTNDYSLHNSQLSTRVYCSLLFFYTESDNEVNMVDAAIIASEPSELVTVCAQIEGVTEIERGFTGQFVLMDDSAGKPIQFISMTIPLK